MSTRGVLINSLVTNNAYADADAIISYWRLLSGIEVDFTINDMQLAIEPKSFA